MPRKFLTHQQVKNAKALQICPFGQRAILFLVAFLWVRLGLRSGCVLPMVSPALTKGLAIGTTAVASVLSLMNLNAVLYLVPYFAYEGFGITRT